MTTPSTETLPVAVPVTAYPLVRPEIVLAALDEPPFAVDCLELRYWCIIPRVGETGSWGDYELPGWKLSEAVEARALRPARVHDEECVQIEARAWKPRAGWQPTGTVYGRLTEEGGQWLAVSLVYEGKMSVETSLDDNFEANWGGVSRTLDDRGAVETAPDGSLRLRDRAALLNGSGAGLFTVGIGAKSLPCLRVIECDIEDEVDTFVVSYWTREGRMVLVQRYKRPSFLQTAEFPVILDEGDHLIVDGLTYLHWYDTVTSFGL